jgi:hypothetical protein
MFRIRQVQYELFAQQARAEFVAKMRAYLRSAFAGWVSGMDDDALDEWVRAALVRCEQSGVTTEPEAAQLVLLLLVLGLDAAERRPFVAPILDDRRLLPIGKVRALIRAARAHRVDRLEEVLVFETMAAPDEPQVEVEG